MKWSISNCSFAIGGINVVSGNLKSVEVIGNNFSFNLPPLPIRLGDHSSVVTIDNELLIIGSNTWVDPYTTKNHPPKEQPLSFCLPLANIHSSHCQVPPNPHHHAKRVTNDIEPSGPL